MFDVLVTQLFGQHNKHIQIHPGIHIYDLYLSETVREWVGKKSQHHPVLTLPPTQYFNGCLYLSNLDPSSAWLKTFTLLCKLTAN